MAVTGKWRQRYLNSQEGLGALFPQAVTEWSPAQEQLVSWLRYYDGFYDRLSEQDYVADREYVQHWMVDYDEIVDAFFVWFKVKSDEKRAENRKDRNRRDWDADVPRASEHEQVYKAKHQ